MLKRRNTVSIGNVANYMQEASESLQLLKNKLENDIDNMLSHYQGIDAETIGGAFKNSINNSNGLIQRLNYYSKYMQSLSNHDKETITNANKKINTMLQSGLVNTNNSIYTPYSTNTDNSPFITLKMNNFEIGGDKNV